MRILVVEDEPVLRTQLAQAIAAAGHTVDCAADGAQAHYLGEVEAFDAVVLDLGLPVLDGLQETWLHASDVKGFQAVADGLHLLLRGVKGQWS